MKRIDSKTQQRLYVLFIPLAIVSIIEIVYLWFDKNILKILFGLDIDILEWTPTLLLFSAMIIFIGYSIAAIKQKCWAELAIAGVILLVMLCNMSNFFVNLL